MKQYVAVPDVPPSQAVRKRKRSDPATYHLDELRRKIPHHWHESPIQAAVTPDLPSFGFRPFTIRKVG